VVVKLLGVFGIHVLLSAGDGGSIFEERMLFGGIKNSSLNISSMKAQRHVLFV